ncbi:Uncharacterised protein [Mycobacterium tuberculosis]|nr:Uncharacterised protein [Mycobacterium tuberculosis]
MARRRHRAAGSRPRTRVVIQSRTRKAWPTARRHQRRRAIRVDRRQAGRRGTARDGSVAGRHLPRGPRLRPRRQHPARIQGAQAGGAADVATAGAGDGAAWLVELAGGLRRGPHGARNADRTPEHDGVAGRRQRAGTRLGPAQRCTNHRLRLCDRRRLPPAGCDRLSRPGAGQSRTASP